MTPADERPDELALVRALLLELGRPALAAWSASEYARRGDVEVAEVRAGCFVRITFAGECLRAYKPGELSEVLRATLDQSWADHDADHVRRHLRLVPKPLAYCRADNDNGRRR